MATIKIDKFGGIAPRQHPTQLADGMAVMAHNCILKNSKLVPMRHPKVAVGIPVLLENGLDDISNANSIHVWRKHDGSIEFLLFPGMTWKADGNIANDSKTRTVITGDTGQTFTDSDGVIWRNAPAMWFRDGGERKIKVLSRNPLAPLKASRGDGAVELDENRRYTFFFVTWVDDIGYESPISAPSLIEKDGQWVEEDVEYMDGDVIVFKKIEDLPEEAVSVRVYKVVTGMEEGRIQFIQELSREFVIDGDFPIKVKDENAGEVLNAIESMPPDLRNVLAVPGSFYCGFSPRHPKTVMFSEVGLLYSWPIAYRFDIKDRIVALAVSGNAVVVLTNSSPYILSGTSPESITITKAGDDAACISEQGVCVYRNVVYFVSNTGLMAISPNGDLTCQNLTVDVFNRDQWQALGLNNCKMSIYDGILRLFFTTSSGEHTALNIALNEDGRTAITTHDVVAKCMCVDSETDIAYFCREV